MPRPCTFSAPCWHSRRRCCRSRRLELCAMRSTEPLRSSKLRDNPRMWTWLHRLASPPSFYRFADALAPWLYAVALLLLAAGVYGGLFLAPPDYQQGDAFRIIYVHVPSAWLSLLTYTLMAVAGAIALIWRIKLAECVLVS